VCNIDLMLTDRQGIEIDYCPECRGIWLDRGGLDKIIERSVSPAPQNHAPEQRGNYRPVPQACAPDQRSGHHQPAPPPYNPKHQGNYRNYGPQGHHEHKRKSFLEEIFDFD
jgi:uncharacterized protein